MNVHTTATKRSTLKRSDTKSVSFDVFDTFIMRACTTPDGVIERAFQLSPVFELFPDVSTSYVEHRRQAEARARKAALRDKGSAEVTIEEIYRQFPLRLFQLQRDMLPQLIDAEFAAELELCRCNPDMLRQYRELRMAGARTGFISDTYWSVQQLGRLLHACCPTLQWDFLYASCQSGTDKSGGLFKIYLDGQSIDPGNATHVGDNPKADVEGARRHGIGVLHVPQASAGLAAIFNREAAAAKLLCQARPSMLDGGLRTVRRLVEAKVPKQSPAFDLGRGVLGPVMHAFDAFVADRIERIARQGGRTCVAFLGRDGFLSHRIWAQGGDTAARYLETNRRIGMMASAKTLDPLAELLSGIPLLDAPTFAEMTKFKSARVEAFFARYHNGRATGQDLVEALPDLLDEGKVADIADGLRAELMTYLRTVFADFDDCTDLVLIDLGYAGSIQKSLRRVFELEGVKARIHGLYLLTLDDGYGDGHEQDTFEGLISDIVVTPHVKRMMLRNIAVLEQMCCAPTGSVLGYRDGRVLYEADMQAADQHSTVQEIQAGVLAYVAAARTQAPELGVTPFADMRSTADHAVAMLGRLLLLPTDDELALLGQLQHDVNLGTTAVTPLLDDSLIGAYEVTQSFPDACMAAGPPMWLAGCFSALSPAQSFLYTLFGAGLLPTDIFGDVKCGQAEILLEDRNGKSSVVQVACYRTGFGEMRIRIPMSRAMSIGRITVPMVQLARAGVIHGPFLQGGETIKQAARSSDILKLDGAEVNWSAMEWCDGRYSATREDAALVIELPIQRLPIAMLSIGLVPHGQGRMLAVA